MKLKEVLKTLPHEATESSYDEDFLVEFCDEPSYTEVRWETFAISGNSCFIECLT